MSRILSALARLFDRVMGDPDALRWQEPISHVHIVDKGSAL